MEEVLKARYGVENVKLSPRPVDIELRYKPGWSAAQRAEADAKLWRLMESNPYKTLSQRTGTSAASRYAAEGNEIRPGFDIDHIQDLQLGGIDDVRNMWPLNSSVNRSLGKQINLRIRNLDIGTRVRNISIW
jgi:hypothetical protein